MASNSKKDQMRLVSVIHYYRVKLLTASSDPSFIIDGIFELADVKYAIRARHVR